MLVGPETRFNWYPIVRDIIPGEILKGRDAAGKIAKWAIELSMYDIEYKPRTAIEAQGLSDFVAEWTEAQLPEEIKKLEFWMIYFDGSL